MRADEAVTNDAVADDADDAVADDAVPEAGGVIAYLLSGYPVLSQTFVRDEIMTLRGAGHAVDVTSVSQGDQARIPLAWSGPVRTMEDVTWPEAVRDLAWWAVRRPRALVRLARAFHATGHANRRMLVRGVPSVARRLAHRDVAVCHTHFGWRAMVPAFYISALLGRPATVTLHAADIYLASDGFARRVNLADRIFTVCRYNVERLAELGVDTDRVSVVPCGVDVDVPVPPVTDPYRVVSVGRLVSKKGMDVLVRAFRAVVDAVPQAHLEIVGEGPEEDRLRKLVADLGLGDAVDFVGSLDHAATLERIGGAAAFALACRVAPNGDSDAVPVAIREALARERPVVTTAVAGIPENVDDEVGWVVPSEDVDALAAALVECLTDRELRERKGAAARRRQAEHYTLGHSMRLLTRHWSELSASRAAGRR